MKDTQLYEQLLGLKAPWGVAEVAVNVETQEVEVRVAAESGTQWVCPDCGQVGRLHDLREERRWRHLDSCGFTTWLVARVPRVDCSEHGVKTVQVPWSGPNSRFTLAFECFAITLLGATKVQSRTASLLRLSPGQIHDLMARAVARGLARRDRDEILPVVSLDEKSLKRGHVYVTVLGDSLGKRVLEVSEGRTLESTVQLLECALSPAQKAGVRAVSMDLWPAFMSARQSVLGHADTVHDRFHIVQYLSQAVDQTRRQEHKRLTLEARQNSTENSMNSGSMKPGSMLNRTKYLWLKNPENLTEKQCLAFLQLRDSELLTAKVWAFKESFREFFTLPCPESGRAFLENWYRAALELDCAPLTKVADMLLRHQEGLFAYLKHRITNGIAEGLNSQIQEIKTVARGFRRFANFRVAILFFLGKLDLSPQTSP